MEEEMEHTNIIPKTKTIKCTRTVGKRCPLSKDYVLSTSGTFYTDGSVIGTEWVSGKNEYKVIGFENGKYKVEKLKGRQRGIIKNIKESTLREQFEKADEIFEIKNVTEQYEKEVPLTREEYKEAVNKAIAEHEGKVQAYNEEQEKKAEAKKKEQAEADKKSFYRSLPRLKDGSVDFDKMTSEQALQYSEYEYGADATIAMAKESIAGLTDDIKKLEEKRNNTHGFNDKIKIDAQINVLQGDIDTYSNYIDRINTERENALKAEQGKADIEKQAQQMSENAQEAIQQESVQTDEQNANDEKLARLKAEQMRIAQEEEAEAEAKKQVEIDRKKALKEAEEIRIKNEKKTRRENIGCTIVAILFICGIIVGILYKKHNKDIERDRLIVASNKEFVRYSGDSVFISIKCNEPWHASCDAKWIVLSDSVGNCNKQIVAYSTYPLNEQYDFASICVHIDNSDRKESILIFCTDDCGKYTIHRNDSIVDCQGNVYPTIQAGELIWMAENLQCTEFDSESEFAGIKIFSSNEIDNDMEQDNPCFLDGRRMVDDKNLFCKNQERYGLLYNVKCLFPHNRQTLQNQSSSNTNYQSICPNGWHIPDKSEIQYLMDFLGGEDKCGIRLRSQEDWANEDKLPQIGNDCIGFNVYPSGFGINGSDSILLKGVHASIWFLDRNGCGTIDFSPTYVSIKHNHTNEVCLSSVRCVKNAVP